MKRTPRPCPTYWTDEPITPHTVRKLQAELLKEDLDNEVRELRRLFFCEIAKHPQIFAVNLNCGACSNPQYPERPIPQFSNTAIDLFASELVKNGFNCVMSDNKQLIHISWSNE